MMHMVSAQKRKYTTKRMQDYKKTLYFNLKPLWGHNIIIRRCTVLLHHDFLVTEHAWLPLTLAFYLLCFLLIVLMRRL